LFWGLREVSRAVRGWQQLASHIPDLALRDDALRALAGKRANIDGAALFWSLPRRRNRDLLQLLVVFEILADFLDNASERGAHVGIHNGTQLHRALIDALDPQTSLSDYYRFHPWKEDGGYLRALVEECRARCRCLPSYHSVKPLALRAAHLAQVLPLNHEPDPARRNETLMLWASEHPGGGSLTWFESSGAASAWLTILALLALAAEPNCDTSLAGATYAAYLPWVCLTGTMLDSYCDAVEDVASGAHSYLSHYQSIEVAAGRLGELLRRAAVTARGLPDGRRHAVIVACMAAMYLTKDTVRTPRLYAHTHAIAHSGGSLTRLLMPVLRLWRTAYRLRSDRQPPVITHSYGLLVGRPRVVRRALHSKLPQGTPLPCAAQTLMFWRWPHTYLEACRKRYGPTFTIRPVGMPPLVFMAEPADIKAIITAPPDVLHPGAGAAVISPLVGKSSFMLAEEQQHLAGRKAILPAFHHHVIAEHAETVRELTHRTIDQCPLDTPFAIHPHLRALTLNVILHTLFHTDDFRRQELHTALLAMLRITASLALQEPQLKYLPGWRGSWNDFLTYRAKVDALLYDLIANPSSSRETGALTSLLDASNPDGSPLSPQQIRDNLMSIILAGHETTASQLAWACQLLAYNPRILDRLVNAIDRDDETYLLATVQEVLRHRPVFLFAIPREVCKPMQIGRWAYEPPAHLLGCIHLMQHDPGIYPNPDEFRPERFLENAPAPLQWLPWGGGRKRCPGHALATLEMRVVLRTLLAQASLRPAGRKPEPARWRSVIVTPGGGSQVILAKRPTRKRHRHTTATHPSDYLSTAP
jgi:cytochrome P450